MEFSLSNPYPNPFNSSTELEFGIPSNSHVELKIFNTLGQEMSTLVDETRTAGIYSIRWNGKDSSGLTLPSGIYICRIRSGNFVDSKKMILLK